jgi:F-type H+-transporting ATPase subunit gamma
MALSTKTIKRRIKSIGNTKKITKAMEMISAVKMRRAVAHNTSSRTYTDVAWQMLKHVAEQVPLSLHPLLHQRPVKRIGIVFITSNRGLAGGFNTKLLQETHAFIEETQKLFSHTIHVDIILMGKKGRKIFQYFKHPISAEFEKIDLTTRIEEILPLAHMVTKEYIEEKYDKIFIAYTHFFSAIKQTPTVKQILPLSDETKQNLALEDKTNQDETDFEEPKILFEPNPQQVVEILLPRLTEVQIYQAILESDASEHSARMMAMQSASDAAGDMISELNTTFNKARQAAITQEIMEVIGGAAALG